jgi:hypothetical protein
MAKLTLTEYIAEVKLVCRNIPTSDPWYAYFTKYVTRARNKIIRRALELGGSVNLFTDLSTSWTAGPLVASGYATTGIPHPADAIAINRITSAQSATAPTWTSQREHPLVIETWDTFAMLDKTATGYAQIAVRKANAWYLYPTPSAGYEDYVRMYGIREETPLAAGGDVFFSASAWDDITVQKTAAMLFRVRGWGSRASELEDAVETELQRTVNVAALEQQGQMETLTVEGAPSRSTIYLG